MAVENSTLLKVTAASFVVGVVVGFQLNRGLRGVSGEEATAKERKRELHRTSDQQQ